MSMSSWIAMLVLLARSRWVRLGLLCFCFADHDFNASPAGRAEKTAQHVRCRAAIQTAPHLLCVRAMGAREQGSGAPFVAVARPRERGSFADGIAAPVEAAGA